MQFIRVYQHTRILLTALLFCTYTVGWGQCTGELGPAIFTEDFGQGTTSGPPLPAGVTSYQYVSSNTQDGQYTVSADLGQLNSWHQIGDHTGNQNGKAFVVNASFAADQFYEIAVNGLCGNTTYEFSAWVINLLRGDGGNPCSANEIPVNVRFEIWDALDTTLLASSDTGNLFSTAQPQWDRYGLLFTSAAGQTGVILRMRNNGPGGCGNDLAIDDLSFNPCGDEVSISDNTSNSQLIFCASELPQFVQLSAMTDTAVFATPEYQWEENTGSGFVALTGETSATLDVNVTQPAEYRLRIAEDAANITNDQCVNFSDVFDIDVQSLSAPTAADPDYVLCNGENGTIAVNAVSGLQYDWYSDAAASTLLQADSQTLSVSSAGSYYVTATDPVTGCVSSVTEVVVRDGASPQLINQSFTGCVGDTITLDAGVAGFTYIWSTGEMSQTIDVNQAGIYTVTALTVDGCSGMATFTVTLTAAPTITGIEVNGGNVTVQATGSDLAFSLNGGMFQTSPQFALPAGDVITIVAQNSCGSDTAAEGLFQAPQYFTPNGDGYNDRWNLRGVADETARLYIFDRYGKLLKEINPQENLGWDGTYNDQPLPSSDYWFELRGEAVQVSGHFSLKR